MDTEWEIPSTGKRNTQSSTYIQALPILSCCSPKTLWTANLSGKGCNGKEVTEAGEEGPGHLASVVEGGETDTC